MKEDKSINAAITTGLEQAEFAHDDELGGPSFAQSTIEIRAALTAAGYAIISVSALRAFVQDMDRMGFQNEISAEIRAATKEETDA